MNVMLNSWKEIAEYLAVGVRTAQRWEGLYGMPVHRLPGSAKICFALAKELDHWMQSAPVRLNRSQASAQALHRPPSPKSMPTVMAVDDNDVHLYALHRALTAAGFQVFGVRTGSEAIIKAFQFMPSAIILDVDLPDVNGFEVCRRLKAEAGTAAIPVIFHTSMEDSYEARQQARALGAAGFLAYPMNLQTMMAMIKSSIAPSSWPRDIDRFNFDSTSRLQERR
ncbi:MAG TPA: response regulator [Terriglobales bacterium]|nr:response regulator [Terriglobales bacterium]